MRRAAAAAPSPPASPASVRSSDAARRVSGAALVASRSSIAATAARRASGKASGGAHAWRATSIAKSTRSRPCGRSPAARRSQAPFTVSHDEIQPRARSSRRLARVVPQSASTFKRAHSATAVASTAPMSTAFDSGRRVIAVSTAPAGNGAAGCSGSRRARSSGRPSSVAADIALSSMSSSRSSIRAWSVRPKAVTFISRGGPGRPVRGSTRRQYTGARARARPRAVPTSTASRTPWGTALPHATRSSTLSSRSSANSSLSTSGFSS